METLLPYLLLILPGIVLITLAFLLVRSANPILRVVMLILGFILIRDAMTPTGLWEFGVANGMTPWLRMSHDPFVLVAFGLGSLVLVGATLIDPKLRRLVTWGRPRPVPIIAGFTGGVLAAAPFVLLSMGTPISERGGDVALATLLPLAFMAFAGNFSEEVFFRGYLQGWLEQQMPKLRAALSSGVIFAACHVFLATTVTDVGWPLLVFTLVEGLVCALLRMRWGVIPAAIAHGTAIFLMSAGLL
ncbi:MAG TPA: CPBP family intramembrane metalloprotease [Candidatus Agrococcus pullicola]|uniref:CPBP family intramembrane metalloprotease n=1 Tax=Candidatus Agrococcus pullicola TaxID=2838429 RepID=A0A9D2C8N1_9MICO|nr:CPBP family intramembrane metalloprotease [Candidatus Agrococcus pullicola]